MGEGVLDRLGLHGRTQASLVAVLIAVSGLFAFGPAQAQGSDDPDWGSIEAEMTGGQLKFGNLEFDLDGMQPGPTLRGSMNRSGGILLKSVSGSFPSATTTVGDDDLTVKLLPVVNPDWSGYYDDWWESVTSLGLTARFRLKIEGSLDGEDLGDSCYVGAGANQSFSTTLTSGSVSARPPSPAMTGSPYDPGTRKVVLVNNTATVPVPTGCGSAALGPALGLPAATGQNRARIEITFTPNLHSGHPDSRPGFPGSVERISTQARGGARQFTSILLQDGRVLIAGGSNGGRLKTAELFDPESNTFSPTGPMVHARSGAGAALLPDGKVLIVGGAVSDVAEIYDPSSGTFSPTGSTNFPVYSGVGRTLVATPDGQAFVMSVEYEDQVFSDQFLRIESYDHSTGTFSLESPKLEWRWTEDPAFVLPGGKIWFPGIQNDDWLWVDSYLFDPDTGTGHFGPEMPDWAYSRNGVSLVSAMTQLSDGSIFFGGGMEKISYDLVDSSSLYDPTSNAFVTAPRLITGLSDAAAAQLPDGRVVVAGGFSEDWMFGDYPGIVQILDLDTGRIDRFDDIPSNYIEGRTLTAMTLQDGRVLFLNEKAEAHVVSVVPLGKSSLVVDKSGNGSGVVSSDPAGVNCGPTCIGGFEEGTEITLTAEPARGSKFTGWSGACSGTDACDLTMEGARHVTANFELKHSLNAASISAGGSHACAVRHSGQGVCWGFNGNGRLGDGSTTRRLVPTPVSGLADAASISSGGAHSCAVKVSGQAVCWGNNENGRLGDDSTSERLIPAAVSGLPDAASISSGGAHSCAVKVSGEPVCWGSNGNGRLGDGTTAQRRVPTPVSGLAQASSITAGSSHTCATTQSGQVVCWGRNTSGQLGDGTTTQRLVPTPVSGLTDAVAVSAGSGHTCAIRKSGSVVCWGANDTGALGDGTMTQRLVPTSVPDLNDVVAISAAYGQTCAIRKSGQLLCWGADGMGQTSEGETVSRSTPTPVPGLDKAVAASAGGGFTCAIREPSESLCWGMNYTGALGTGDQDDRSGPSRVLPPPGYCIDTYCLDVSRSGDGNGTVVSNPAGIDCGRACEAELDPDSEITLTAQATFGSEFTGWAGACSGTGPCTVTMSQDHSVTASFAKLPAHSLSVTRSGDGNGSVVSDPAGIDCGSTCAAEFVEGTEVTLTASSGDDSTFGGWSGACSGESSTCQVLMSQARTVTATFGKKAVVPPPGKPVVSIRKVAPKAVTVKAGRTASFKVRVSNSGESAARAVKVCAKVPARFKRKVKPAVCRTLGTLAPGQTKVAAVKVRTTRTARGKVRVGFNVSAAGLSAKSGSAILKVKPRKASRRD